MTMAQATEITPVMLASKIAFEQLQQQMNDKTIDAFMALPELFEGNGDAQHKLEECILQLVDNDTKCQCAAQALQEVGSTYAAADTAQRRDTDLQDALNACSVTVLEGHPGHTNPKTTAVWKQWCEETGQEAEDDDDDDMQVGKGAEFKNNKCLLSAISIYEMKDPVFDRHKFVYERQKVVGYIKQGGNGNSNAHPSRQGEQITLQELKPAKRVKMAGEKWRREQALHRTQAADDEEIL